jgi:SnoaL-like domain
LPTADRAIQNLIASYAFLFDDGNFAGLGELLDHADFSLGPAHVRGRAEIEALAHSAIQVYADGTPRTRHVTTNLIINVDDQEETATSRSYFTVFQQADGFALQPIACGRYEDRFELVDGNWRFAFRSVSTNLVGDISHHRRVAG